MNQLTIIGNLTRDPETRETSAGDVTDFTVAVNNKDDADFFRVSAWGDIGANCAKYLSKGSKVAVIGRVSAHAYTTKEGTPAASLDVSAARVEFLNSRQDDQDNSTRNSTRNNTTNNRYNRK